MNRNKNNKTKVPESEFGAFIEEQTIQFQRMLPGPVERVWAYLTEADKCAAWLARADMELKVGGKVKLHFDHRNLSQHKETIPKKYEHHGETSTMEGNITEIKAPTLLSYTWGEDWGEDSEVTFELEPVGDKVQLTVTHRRLGDDKEMHIGIAAGWHTHLGILNDRLQGREPKGFWAVHMPLEKVYEERLS